MPSSLSPRQATQRLICARVAFHDQITELSLPSWPPEIKHKYLRNQARDLNSEVFLNQRQTEIDTRRDAGAAVRVTTPNVKNRTLVRRETGKE